MDIPNQHPDDSRIIITPHTPSNAWKWITVVTLVLIIGGASAFAAYKYWPSSGLTPEEAVKQMPISLAAVKSVTYQVNISGEGQSKGTGGNFSLGLTGSTDWHDKADIKNSNNIKLDASASDGSFSASTELELMVLNKILYLKLVKAPILGFFDLTKFKDQWIKLESTDATKTGFVSSSTISDFTEKTAQAKVILEQASIFKIVENVGKEKIGDISVYHLKIEVDKPGIKKLARDLEALAPEEDRDPAKLAEFDKMIDELNISMTDLWIGAEDSLPYKITTSVNIDDQERQTKGTINFSLILSDYNKPLTLTAPTDVKTFEEIIGEVMGSGMSNIDDSISAKEKNQTIKTELQSIRSLAEIHYSNNQNSYERLCISSEVKQAQEKIQLTNPRSGYACETNGKAYAVRSTLLTTNEQAPETWCIDSTGFNNVGQLAQAKCVK